MLNLILFGAPGAGKGTQAKIISEKFSLKHISTGDLLRSEVANNTELGIIAKKYMHKGNLLPDDVIIKMVEKYIKEHRNCCKGFIFDGFPRTLEQAEAFDKMLVRLEMEVSLVVNIKVETEILIERLQKRAIIENRKDDSEKSIIQNRLSLFEEKTLPIREYYKKQAKLNDIDGKGDIEDISQKIEDLVLQKVH